MANVIANPDSPFKRIYFDITHEEHAQMARSVKEAGVTQRKWLRAAVQEFIRKGGTKKK